MKEQAPQIQSFNPAKTIIFHSMTGSASGSAWGGPTSILDVSHLHVQATKPTFLSKFLMEAVRKTLHDGKTILQKTCAEHVLSGTQIPDYRSQKEVLSSSFDSLNLMKNLHAFLVSSKFQIVFKPQDTDGSGNGVIKMQLEIDSSWKGKLDWQQNQNANAFDSIAYKNFFPKMCFLANQLSV